MGCGDRYQRLRAAHRARFRRSCSRRAWAAIFSSRRFRSTPIRAGPGLPRRPRRRRSTIRRPRMSANTTGRSRPRAKSVVTEMFGDARDHRAPGAHRRAVRSHRSLRVLGRALRASASPRHRARQRPSFLRHASVRSSSSTRATSPHGCSSSLRRMRRARSTVAAPARQWTFGDLVDALTAAGGATRAAARVDRRGERCWR